MFSDLLNTCIVFVIQFYTISKKLDRASPHSNWIRKKTSTGASATVYSCRSIGNVKMSKCQNFDIKCDTQTNRQTNRQTNMGIHKAALRQVKVDFFWKFLRLNKIWHFDRTYGLTNMHKDIAVKWKILIHISWNNDQMIANFMQIPKIHTVCPEDENNFCKAWKLTLLFRII